MRYYHRTAAKLHFIFRIRKEKGGIIWKINETSKRKSDVGDACYIEDGVGSSKTKIDDIVDGLKEMKDKEGRKLEHSDTLRRLSGNSGNSGNGNSGNSFVFCFFSRCKRCYELKVL